jgi:hypothetical protein
MRTWSGIDVDQEDEARKLFPSFPDSLALQHSFTIWLCLMAGCVHPAKIKGWNDDRVNLASEVAG